MSSTDQMFREDQEVEGLFWPDGSSIKVDKNGIEKITVIMEYGQMAGVPWFAVWKDGKIVSKHNAAFIESVNLC